MSPRSLSLVAIVMLAGGCASSSFRTGSPWDARGPGTAPTTIRIEPSRLIPDLDAERPYRMEPDGTKLFLVKQMRLIERPDGGVSMAHDLLLASRARHTAHAMPSRLGGGYVFMSASDTATRVWRAEEWLAPLKPLLKLHSRFDEVLAGFDRAYLASTRSNDATVAFDPVSGDFVSFGSVPIPMGVGPMIFADPWRAVYTSDLRGPLATFDAGATWVPLGLSGAIDTLRFDGDSIIITTKGSLRSYALDGAGRLTPIEPQRVDNAREIESRRPGHGEETNKSPKTRPMRLAVERGIPLTSSSVLVAHGGELIEISMASGSVVRTVRDAYPASLSECHGLALGWGVGFVCGAQNGSTVVFAYDDTNGVSVLRPVLTYLEPKAVFSSGNGALVVQASCPETEAPGWVNPGLATTVAATPGLAATTDQEHYCVRHVRGDLREISVHGGRRAERVVALADGRVAVVVAPLPRSDARLALIDGSKTVTRKLVFDGLSNEQLALAQHGMWMHGAIEIEPGVVGVWVEGGGPIIGLRVGLDGNVVAGPVQTTSGDLSGSGRVAIVWRSAGVGLETVDGGMTWAEFRVPDARDDAVATTRGCSAVGCAVAGWLRVGWGKPSDADQSSEAPEPAVRLARFARSSRSEAQQLTCAPTGRASYRPTVVSRNPSSPSPAASAGTRLLVSLSPSQSHRVSLDSRTSAWEPFGMLLPPTLGPDDVGVSGGRENSDPRFRAFAWGGKTADWSRVGRWFVVFDDPYSAVSMLASSPSVSPWADAGTATLYLNSVRVAQMDVGGEAAVIGWCLRHGQCRSYSIAAGQEPLELFMEEAGQFPVVASAVKTPDGWFMLSENGDMAEVYFADPAGYVRLLGSYPRSRMDRSKDLRLVRRANGSGVAFWLVASSAQGNRRVFVLPIETTTGELMPLQDGLIEDASGSAIARCSSAEDGWLVEEPLPIQTQLPNGAGFATSVRMRLRVDAGRTCVEAIAGRAHEDEIQFGHHHQWLADNASRTVPMVVWDYRSSRKYELVCGLTMQPGQPKQTE